MLISVVELQPCSVSQQLLTSVLSWLAGAAPAGAVWLPALPSFLATRRLYLLAADGLHGEPAGQRSNQRSKRRPYYDVSLATSLRYSGSLLILC
jgi:hypothetical protein